MATVGRNQPCPCGSGRKYKKCCGRPGKAVSSPPATAAGGGHAAPTARGGSAVSCDLSAAAEPASPPPAAWRRPDPPRAATPPAASPRVRCIDKDVLGRIRRRFEQAAAELEAELGLDVTVGRMSYLAENVRIDLEAAVVRDDGVVMDRHAMCFLERCGEYGLEEGDLGRVFECNGLRFQVIGLRPRANDPVLCDHLRKDGERSRHRLPASLVREWLHAGEAGAAARPAFRVLPRERAAGEE